MIKMTSSHLIVNGSSATAFCFVLLLLTIGGERNEAKLVWWIKIITSNPKKKKKKKRIPNDCHIFLFVSVFGS